MNDLRVGQHGRILIFFSVLTNGDESVCNVPDTVLQLHIRAYIYRKYVRLLFVLLSLTSSSLTHQANFGSYAVIKDNNRDRIETEVLKEVILEETVISYGTTRAFQ